MNPRSRIARLRASAKARKNPLNRAVGAPRVVPAPALCPLGKCEHAGLLHGERALLLEERTRTYCTVCNCTEDP